MKHSFEVFESDIVNLDLWLNLNKVITIVILEIIICATQRPRQI